MSIIHETTGDVEACDGCGRIDAGPGTPLDVREYTVVDPNVGTAVMHHYCPSCAYDRNSNSRELLNFGWERLTDQDPPVATDDEEQPRSRRR
jgi:hypothetical protein